MRNICRLSLSAALSIVLVAPLAARTVYVPGHRTAKGVYVEPHYRTVPDAPIYRGYTAYPNGQPYVNPYGGQVGAVPPYGYQPGYPYAPDYVPNSPGYVPNAPAPVPVPVAPYYYGR